MKNIDFIFVGDSKNKAFSQLEKEYHEKVTRYTSSKIEIIKDSAEKNMLVKKRNETLSILKKVEPNNMIIICDENGKSFDSRAFSEKISQWQVAAQRVVFIIGGAYGIDIENLLPIKSGSIKLRLSDFVMPHELARIVLLEQVYRALTILNGEKYHH